MANPQTVTDINARLLAIKEKRMQLRSGDNSRGGSRGVSPSGRAAAAHQRAADSVFGDQRQVRAKIYQSPPRRTTAAYNDGQDDDEDDEPPFAVHHTGEQPPLQPTPQFNEEDILTDAEMACLRVVEIDQHVRVLAQLSHSTARARHIEKFGGGEVTHHASSSQLVAQSTDLTVIGDDAIVKIYPRHVVLTRSNGQPLVEFVIAELREINEHEQIHALDFVMQRRDGSSSIIQIQCPHEPARSAIYKLVCAKRSQLAADAGGAAR